MESKKINQLATELAPDLSDLTIIGDPNTGISKKITLSQMASLFTGTVEEYANFAAFPLVGVADTIYIALDTNILYRWNTGTSAYVELSPNIVSSLVFNDANGFDGTINLVGSVATLTITTALTTGSVGFIGASGALLQDNANFFWDDTNNRLGLGTNAPTTALDVFGSGIIGRINGTSTNNAYLGFASAGTNKWSVGNVQSDHRFRIFSEANSAELITILQTGEFGIGIANPLTKFHIDGGATALIANLDANVSVAKSLSFRSDNSNRINLEVSGTESGSNVGADLFIRRYSDAGSLIDTPLTITRSTGAISLTTALSGTTATFSGTILLTGNGFLSSSVDGGFRLRNDANTSNLGGLARRSFWAGGAALDIQIFAETGYGIYLNVDGSTTKGLTLATTGAATFSSSVQVGSTSTSIGGLLVIGGSSIGTANANNGQIYLGATSAYRGIISYDEGPGYLYIDNTYNNNSGNIYFRTKTSGTAINALTIAGTGAATFSSSVSATVLNSSVGNDAIVFETSNCTTGYQFARMRNNSAYLLMGIEGTTAGNLQSGDAANASVITTGTSTILSLGTNQVERMRLTTSGEILMHSATFNSANAGQLFGTGGDTYLTTDTSIVLYVNRKGNDGTLVDFRQDNNVEGTISVSGTTVSYNGGHLARYTQTESNQRIEGLLKGTVMSNLDKMAEWINPETKQPYENEQLNCMKISDVEGDINVAGVFVNWDNDDKEFTNDMNIAMTGDMIIRIAENLVVQKGQLLMSAGDGTAKPQEDDIIRSKTIAKVTSNHITCVYEDGTYCVPCVLMAC
jgi:hypothetical protein